MIQTDAPPTPPPAAEVVIARSDHTTVAASLDLPLSLVKGARREEMVVRRVLFVSAAVTQVRPADGAPERYRWTLAGFLEREYCVRSLTGAFACTTPETAPLPDKADGEAAMAAAGQFPLAVAAGQFPLAVAAEGLLSSTLAGRSDEIFASDRQAAVDPFLKTAGVRMGGAAGAKAAPRR